MSSSGPPSLGRPPHSEPRGHRGSGSGRMANSVGDQESADRASVGSGVLDDRPNNWDFSDWRPISAFDGRASRPMKKKANLENAEHSTSGAGASSGIRKQAARPNPNEGRGNKPVTPATFPRTRGAGLSLTSKHSLENLRQELTYSDVDEVLDSVVERNNERPQQRRSERGSNPQLPREMERNETRAPQRGTSSQLRNPNLNQEEEGPDSNQIVGRLMQIRDYIKQSSTMIATLQNSTDARSKDQLEKLMSLVNHLKEQEKGYLSLLQQILASREEDLYMRQNSTDQNTSRPESDSEVTSELDIHSNSSDENETDGNPHAEDNEAQASNLHRPIIEDRLGRHGDTDTELTGHHGNTVNNGVEAEDEAVGGEEGGMSHINQLLSRRAELESYLADKSGELSALKQQQSLLKMMLEQQKELQALHSRREQAERKLMSRASESQGRGAMSLAAAAGQHDASGSDGEDEKDGAKAAKLDNNTVTVHDLRVVQDRLKRIRQQFSHKDQVEPAASGSKPATSSQPSPGSHAPRQTAAHHSPDEMAAAVTEAEKLSRVTEERLELQGKLADLQQKKLGMDALLLELQKLRASRFLVNNDLEGASSVTSSQALMTEGAVAAASDDHTAQEASDLLKAMDAHKKLQQLEEVKSRLGELRDLVQYYHAGGQGLQDRAAAAGAAAMEADDDQSSLPEPTANYEDAQLMENLRNLSREGVEGLLRRHAESLPFLQRDNPSAQSAPVPKPAVRGATETEQSDTTETASQLSSSMGAWNEDPEMVEKVQRLKAAKEKLRRLQELVAMVQQSPDMAHALPDDLAELAIGDEAIKESDLGRKDSTSAAVAAVSRANNVSSEVQRLTAAEEDLSQRERFYAAKMAQQQQELEKLMAERENLVQVQSELQRLHDALPSVLAASEQLMDGEALAGESSSDQVPSSAQRKVPPGRPPPPRTQSDERPRPRSGPQEVTFQEPLETVMTNEELYDRMRQQRMLREELRERKKELEQYMKKDRPRRAYARNQQPDNQSDNISYSNKSYQDGASEDVTMATWGGSTIGNLESIDEGDGGDRNQRNEDMDDAYPSDGVIQVEEEEEAQEDSDDNETYTLDDEYPTAQRIVAANRRQNMPSSRQNRSQQAPNTSGAPFQDGTGQYTYNYWAPDNNQLLNNARRENATSSRKKSTQRRKRSAQSRGRSRENSQLHAMQEELKSLKSQMQSLLQGNPLSPNSSGLQQQWSQLQQQQLVNHCYQVLQMQQDLAERFNHLETNLLQQEGFRANYAGGSMSSLLRSPSVPFQTRPATTSAPSLNTSRPARPWNFTLDPQFPDSFAFLQDPAGYAARNSGAESAPNLLTTSTTERSTEDYGRDSYQIPVMSRLGSGGAERSQFMSTDGQRGAAAAAEVGCASIPVETILAQDAEDVAFVENVPRLELEESARPKQRKRSPKRAKASPKNNKESFEVIGKKYRAAAASKLASQSTASKPSPMPRKVYRPGLSGGISGAGYQETESLSSMRSSVPGGDDNMCIGTGDQEGILTLSSAGRTETHGEMNMFENLRETIYAEVATLISQNENRPHFLIELFRELQLLSSDYLRQRALYAVQELVSKHLGENDLGPEKKAWVPVSRSSQPQMDGGLMNSAECTELTPSESLISTDDDKEAAAVTGDGDDDEAGSVNSQRFDYAENVATSSSLSTPSTSARQPEGAWGEDHDPFAQDSLGDTVIHLDQALRRMREYERKLAEVGGNDVTGASPATVRVKAGAAKGQGVRGEGQDPQGRDGQSDGSLSDGQESEKSSVAEELNYPRIDAQQLDGQIKAIMGELIPVLREHMADVCSPQLLQYIRRLVLSLTQHQHTGQQEFVRFFHNQLASILTDSLAKFDGRKMKDCGEDMLVEISEILFNELAFFRLMQDLDDPKAKVKARLKQWRDQDSALSQTSTDTGNTQDAPNSRVRQQVSHLADDERSSSSSSSSSDDDDRKASRAETQPQFRRTEIQIEETSDEEIVDNAKEEDELGKERDDEFAAEVNTMDDGTSHLNNVKIELAPSETKPFTRIGSDEDDEGEDEAVSNEDPSETAVSRDAEKERHDDSISSPSSPCSIHSDVQADLPADVDTANTAAAAAAEDCKDDDKDDDGVTKETTEDADAAVEHTESEPLMNGEVNGEAGSEVTVDDLPVKLTAISKDELSAQLAAESESNTLDTTSVLQSIDISGGAELAGDPMSIKEPESKSDSASRQV